MPQDSKSRPSDVESPDNLEVAPGFSHENLQGWIPALATDDEIRDALEKAFDYRGDVTITTKDGRVTEGYVFDRRSNGKSLNDCSVRMIPKDRDDKVAIRYRDIARVEFTGKDTAAGKSWETWVKKYWSKKAAGESDIRLEPEKLD
jgi:hypothetical protein